MRKLIIGGLSAVMEMEVGSNKSLYAPPISAIRTGPGTKSVLKRRSISRTKWTGGQLRDIRARNGVGRPPRARD